ncbi:MAG: hypothetical protein JXL97_08855 [Bacteroidales bacterium]|nr:hypothetical protein [Bacteroidales bacterium]
MAFKRFLFLLDGFLLGIGGFHVFAKTLQWTENFKETQIVFLAIIGLLLGFVKFRFVFLKFNRRNILRILSKNNIKVWQCFTIRDFIVIILMILLGISLRMVFKLPYIALIPIYFGISVGLGLSFFQYLFAAIQPAKYSKT